MQDMLKLLANPTNQSILSLLRSEPSYARKIGALLELKESEVTRRLRQMEDAGLVASDWAYIGKNVKMYHLEAEGIDVRFEPEGMRLHVHGPRESKEGVVAHLAPRIPPVTHLAGRHHELDLLSNDSSVNVIAGLAGIGKTSLLAYHAARLDAATVFWHSFRGVESLHWLANRIAVFASHHGDDRLLEALQRDAEPAEQRELLMDVFNQPQYSIFLDDVHHIDDEHVRRFVDDAIIHTRKGRLFVTSREHLRSASGQPHVDEIHLTGLEDEAVAQLLAADGADVDDATLMRLRRLVGGHPLALHLLATAAKQNDEGLPSLVERAEGGSMDLQDYLLSELDGRITDSQRRVLTTAAIFRTSFAVADLQAVCSKRIHEKDVMDLVRQYLLLDRGGLYETHDIVRSFYFRMLEDPKPLHARAAKHFLKKGTTEDRIEAMHHFIAAESKDAALKLIAENLDVREYDFIDAGYARLYLRLLDLFDADGVDAHRWAVILDEKGDVHFSQGDHEQALAFYRDAHAYFQEMADAQETPDLAWKMAMAHHRLGNDDAARRLVDDALAATPGDDRTRQRLETLRGELTITA